MKLKNSKSTSTVLRRHNNVKCVNKQNTNQRVNGRRNSTLHSSCSSVYTDKLFLEWQNRVFKSNFSHPLQRDMISSFQVLVLANLLNITKRNDRVILGQNLSINENFWILSLRKIIFNILLSGLLLPDWISSTKVEVLS